MPTWGELLTELKELQERQRAHPAEFGDSSPHDVLRRRYLRALSEKTGRATIVYATAWMDRRDVSPDDVSINLGDVRGFMEAVSNAELRDVDLFLHSPGGSAEAAESILEYLRTRFEHIRVVVPVAAMSAATMLALGGDEIVMGTHSQLGPIDPQFTIFTPEGPRSAPADAIKEQFKLAQDQCAEDSSRLAAWLPILRMYGPGLIAQCDDQLALSKELVARWLERYMFGGADDAAAKAAAAAEWFSDYPRFRSHGRRVSRDEARALDLRIVNLEDDDELQDAMLSVHHAVTLTLSHTGTTKLIENQRGRAYIEISRTLFVREPAASQGAEPELPEAAPVPPAPRPRLNREQRRGGKKRR